MPPSRPVIWTDVSLQADALALVEPGTDVITCSDGSQDGLDRADGVIASGLLRADAPLFVRAPRLRALARVGIGYDRIDVESATAAGVCIINTPDAPTESTAEFAVTLMLALARRLPAAAAVLPAGRWQQGSDLFGIDLAGRTLGLIGFGRIGRRVAEIALALRMRVIAYDPYVSTVPPPVGHAGELAGLLSAADVISVHVPHTPATRHLLDGKAFAVCRPGVLVINAARGPIIDEAALLDALESGRVGGAGIDVWDPEPPPMENPLLRHPRVIATPHIAAFTHEGRKRSHVGAAAQLLQVLVRDERPPSLVNPDVWSHRRRPG